jgi:NAD(P)-dependent dehydrogenase (short-subunit alcohol dehydrogenase family)
MIQDIFGLKGRTALVTGASKGLGKAMARGFALAGADVAVCSRGKDELASALKEILAGSGARGEYFVADLAEREQTEGLARAVLERFGRVDILVNNAGTNIPQPVDAIVDDDWDRTLELNLTAAMVLTRTLTPGMKERRWGRVIHISSIMGLASKAGRHSYSASKAALIGFTKSGALDLAPFNVTVNCIAPGPFLTDLPASVLNEEQRRVAAERTALGRWGRPEEIVGVALLLAGEAGSYMTGSVVLVDGGLLSTTY